MSQLKKVITPAGSTRWQIDYYDPAGRRIRRRFDRKAQAQDYLAKVVSTIREGRYEDIFEARPERTATFDEALEAYVRTCRHQRSWGTFKAGILKVLGAHFAGHLLHEITYLDLELYRQERLATPTWRGDPRSPARVNRELAVLRHLLNKAVEWGLLETSPFHRGKSLTLKEAGHRQRFLTEEEADRLLAACPGHLRPIVELALHTGLRAGELLPLKWEQIRDGFLYVEAGMAKGGKGRAVPLNNRALEILHDQRQKHQLRSPHVFGRRFGSVRKSFGGALRRAGISDFRFHDLRHTFASRLVRRGVPLRAVQEILGHADIRMTMRYAHLAPGDLKEAVAVLDLSPHGENLYNNEKKEDNHDRDPNQHHI